MIQNCLDGEQLYKTSCQKAPASREAQKRGKNPTMAGSCMRGCGVKQRPQCDTDQSPKFQHQVGPHCLTGERHTCPPMWWHCRAGSQEKATASCPGSQTGAGEWLQQVGTALPGSSSHAPPDLHGCNFFPRGPWWVRAWGTYSLCAISPSLPLHAGMLALNLNQQGKLKCSIHSGIHRNRTALSGMGLWGFPLNWASKHCPAAERLSALVWKLACSWQAFGCTSYGHCLELWQTRIDRQYFHLGWHLSGSPLCTLRIYLQCQRKNNFKRKTKSFRAHACWTSLGSQFESFFLGYSSFTKSTYTSTSHHDFYIKSYKWS